MIVIYAVSFLLLVIGLYRIVAVILNLPSQKAVEALRNIHGKRTLTQRLQDTLLSPARLLAKLFPMGEYKARRMQADFSRLRITQTPQEFVSTTLARSLLLAVIGLMFIPLGIPWLALLTAATAVISYFQSMQAIRKKVEARNREIESELPRLVETLNYSLQENRDFLAFFEKYRRVSGKALGTELDRLILDMKTGNIEAALRRMDARLGLPPFSALCAVLCGVNQGVDQQTSLLVLEQDMRVRERETLRRSMEKRPGRIKAASFILTFLMILLFMVPLILLIIRNLQTVGF
jgi:hypothetical protein